MPWKERSVVEERMRSEEHTSELQSRFDIVCRLLLEKKNAHITVHCVPQHPAQLNRHQNPGQNNAHDNCHTIQKRSQRSIPSPDTTKIPFNSAPAPVA